MDPVGDHARAGAITPEVEPVTSLLLHPLLQDPKFLAAVFGLLVTVIFFTGENYLSDENGREIERVSQGIGVGAKGRGSGRGQLR